jgi:methionyl-tRNA synthetase
MLQAAGLTQPKTIFAHGWWITHGEKMSKSLGNVVKPLDLAAVYGVDAFRYFLIRDMTLGRDADFDEERLKQRYLGDLVNDLGNLLHRLTNMIQRYCDGRVPSPGEAGALEDGLRERCQALPDRVFALVEALALNEALEAITETVRETNRYLEQSAPWKLAKAGDAAKVGTVLYHGAEALRIASVLLQPVMPEKVLEIWARLGWEPADASDLAWGKLQPGAQVTVGQPLFPREV